MMRKETMYEVWSSSGYGMKPGPRFGKLHDALLHVGAHIHEASFAIKLPNGDWYRNQRRQSIFRRVSS